jgi:hypothetical protein
LGFERCGAGDRDRLALTTRQLSDFGCQLRNSDFKRIEHLARPSVSIVARSRKSPLVGSRPRNRLPTTSTWSQRLRSWNTISMLRRRASGRPGEDDLLAVHGDRAAIRDVGTGDHLGQRRFAGRVVADEAEAFAGIKSEIDAAERFDRAEALADA